MVYINECIDVNAALKKIPSNLWVVRVLSISFQEISYAGKPQVVSTYILSNLWVSYTALFTFWLGGMPVLLNFLPLLWGYIIFARLAWPLNDVIFGLCREYHLSLYKYCFTPPASVCFEGPADFEKKLPLLFVLAF